jgi:hypothetical protein
MRNMRKTAIITGIVKRENDRTGRGSRVVLLEVETDSGPLLLQMTAAAAHDLKACLTQPSRPAGAWPDVHAL